MRTTPPPSRHEPASPALLSQHAAVTRKVQAHAQRSGSSSQLGSPAAPSATFPIDTNAQLQLVFQYYCRFGRTGGHSGEDTMDNVNWAKFARECPGLVDRRLDRTEVDLIFTKVKTRGKRRITYSQWLDALSAMAAVKFPREDPATAFSLLLSRFVFNCPASQGVGALARAGQLDLHAMTAGEGPAATLAPTPAYTHTGPLQSPPAPTPYAAHAGAYAATPRREETPSATFVPSAGEAPELGPPPPGAATPGATRYPPHQAPMTPGTAAAAQYTTASAAHASRQAAAAAQGYYTGDPHTAMLEAAMAGGEGHMQPRPTSARTPGTRRSSRQEEAWGSGHSRPSSARKSTIRTPVQYGTRRYRPTVAGESNKAGGVYDRLSSPSSFTGVYRRAYMSDGRMNAFSESGVSAMGSKYAGSTNTGSDETIHDIKHLLRPNLKSGKTFK